MVAVLLALGELSTPPKGEGAGQERQGGSLEDVLGWGFVARQVAGHSDEVAQAPVTCRRHRVADGQARDEIDKQEAAGQSMNGMSSAGMVTNGRIMSRSSCSRMWQWYM